MNTRLLIWILAAALIFPSISLGQSSWNMELVGKAGYDGPLTYYASYDDYLYIITNQINPDRYLLSVVDMSNPSHPRRVRSLAEGEIKYGLLRVDSLLYVVALSTDTLIIYSLTDPANPLELARAGFDDDFSLLQRLDEDIIGTPQYYGYKLVSIEDRLNPRTLLTLDLQYIAPGAILIGDYLYISGFRTPGYFRFFEIFDISDTSNPVSVYIDTLESGYSPCIANIDSYIYISRYPAGIDIYNISNPINPVLVDTSLIDFGITDILVSGNYVFASGYFDSLLTLDASNPADPVIANAFYNQGESNRIQLNGENLYFATKNIISMLDVSDPTAPLLMGRYIPGVIGRDVARWQNYAYIVKSYGGFRIFDISDPTEPVGIGYYNTDRQTHKIHIKDGILYLADNYGGVLVFSLADPADPELLSTIFLSTNVYDMHANDSLLYIAGDDGFSIADISDPSNPVIVCDHPTPPFHNNCRTIIPYGDHVFTAESDSGFCIYDVSDFSSPVKINCYDDGYWTEFTIKENLLFASSYGWGFSIFDISDPMNPAFISTTPPAASAISESEGLIYLSYFDEGVKVFDITDLNFPELAGTYVDSGFCNGIVVDNDTAFVSAGDGGLWILRYQSPVGNYYDDINNIPKSLTLNNYPNPFNAATTISYSLQSKTETSLSIYNLLGQRVETLLKGTQAPGEHTLTWDAAHLPSGIYFARLETADRTENIKMVLLK